jgi:hypothetical protein
VPVSPTADTIAGIVMPVLKTNGAEAGLLLPALSLATAVKLWLPADNAAPYVIVHAPLAEATVLPAEIEPSSVSAIFLNGSEVPLIVSGVDPT